MSTDAGFVDVRHASAWPARRFVPLSVRYPWTWWSAIAAAIVVATLLSFEGHLRRGMSGRTLAHFCWTLSCLGIGVALFFANGGFGRFHGESEHARVIRYVRDVTGSRDVFAFEVAGQSDGRCRYRVWDVRTTTRRWWAVSVNGPHTLLPVALYEHKEFRTAPSVIAYQVKQRKQESAELKKMLGARASALTPTC